jgi:hypothetical protein
MLVGTNTGMAENIEQVEQPDQPASDAQDAWETTRNAVESSTEAPATEVAGEAKPDAAAPEPEPPQFDEGDLGVLEDLRAQLFGDGDEDKGAANAIPAAAPAAPNAPTAGQPAQPAQPQKWQPTKIDPAAALKLFGYDAANLSDEDKAAVAPIQGLIEHTNKLSEYTAALESKLEELRSGMGEFQQHRKALEDARIQTVERGIHAEIDKLAKSSPFYAKLYGTSDKLSPEAFKERQALLKGVAKMPGASLDNAASKIAQAAKIRHAVQVKKADKPVQRSTPPRGGNAKPLTGYAAVEAKLGLTGR